MYKTKELGRGIAGLPPPFLAGTEPKNRREGAS